MKQPNGRMQRLQKTSNWAQAAIANPLPYRVSWIAPPIAPNHLTFATTPIASQYRLHPYLLSALQHHH
ncbi:MAG: hypothetical protein ACFE0I_22605 [Elainellaceae cyanobacterium]